MTRGRLTPHPLETLTLSCVGCGYLLRGLDPSGRCPECGADIAASLAARGRGGRLIAKLRAGLTPLRQPLPALARNHRLWLRAVAVATLSLALLPPALAVWQRWREPIPWQRRVPEYPLLALAGWFAASVWLLTLRDRPAPPRPDPVWSPIRLSLRALGLAPAAAAGLAVVSDVVPATEHRRYAVAAAELFYLTPVVLFLLFDYVAYVAARAWAPRTAVLFRLAMLLVTPFLAAPALLGVLSGASFSTAEELRRYPDAVGDAVAQLTATPVLSALALVLCAALAALSLTIWRLPAPGRAVEPGAATTGATRAGRGGTAAGDADPTAFHSPRDMRQDGTI